MESLAEFEHKRWMVSRLLAGWKLAETKDANRLLNMNLVTWDKLDPGIKEWDKKIIRSNPEYLKAANQVMYKQKQRIDFD